MLLVPLVPLVTATLLGCQDPAARLLAEAESEGTTPVKAGATATGALADPAPAPPGFVAVASGTVRLGSPADEPGRHELEALRSVELSYSYAVSMTEVTQAEFAAVLGWNPSFFGGCGAACFDAEPPEVAQPNDSSMPADALPGECMDVGALTPTECGDDCPVENVSWFDALVYANQLSEAQGFAACYAISAVICTDGFSADDDPRACMSDVRGGVQAAMVGMSVDGALPCVGYRLPTEAEWEHAARAGSQTAVYPGGGGNGIVTQTGCSPVDPALDPVAWYGGNSSGQPHPVRRKAPNDWGVYDMLGNVMEWTHDPYPPMGETQPELATSWSAPDRAQRGGSWLTPTGDARAATRSGLPPGERNPGLGFRLVRRLQ